mmetsp:Transcript_41746/g.77230  ORF Transcript_41746/g.77230 Transcript_41746/m.77230 type:complete len:273 (+) Transcript_41746:172-990(+)
MGSWAPLLSNSAVMLLSPCRVLCRSTSENSPLPLYAVPKSTSTKSSSPLWSLSMSTSTDSSVCNSSSSSTTSSNICCDAIRTELANSEPKPPVPPRIDRRMAPRPQSRSSNIAVLQHGHCPCFTSQGRRQSRWKMWGHFMGELTTSSSSKFPRQIAHILAGKTSFFTAVISPSGLFPCALGSEYFIECASVALRSASEKDSRVSVFSFVAVDGLPPTAVTVVVPSSLPTDWKGSQIRALSSTILLSLSFSMTYQSIGSECSAATKSLAEFIC